MSFEETDDMTSRCLRRRLGELDNDDGSRLWYVLVVLISEGLVSNSLCELTIALYLQCRGLTSRLMAWRASFLLSRAKIWQRVTFPPWKRAGTISQVVSRSWCIVKIALLVESRGGSDEAEMGGEAVHITPDLDIVLGLSSIALGQDGS